MASANPVSKSFILEFTRTSCYDFASFHFIYRAE